MKDDYNNIKLLEQCMCKKTKDEEEKRKEGSRDNSVKGVFVFISIVFSLTMAFLVMWPLLHKSYSIREVNINLSIPEDSLVVETILLENESQIKQLVVELDRQSQEITDKYNLLLKSQETESDFFRLVSCIAAFVVALLGFLGYRTIKDIEEKAKSLAGEKASETAKDYVANHLESEVEKQLRDIVGDTTAAKLIREQIQNELIQTQIAPLEERINKLESEKQETERDYSAEEDSSTGGTFAHDGVKEIDKLTNKPQEEEGGEKHE